MAENTTTAEIAIQLEDQISGPAMTAAKELEKLRDSIQADTKAIAAMQKSMKRLKDGGLEGGAAYAALNKKLKEHKQSLAQAQDAYLGLGGGLLSTNKPARDFRSYLAHMQGELGKLPGPLGQVSGYLGQLGRLLTVKRLLLAGVVIALAAVTFAFIKLTTAMVRHTAQLYKYAVAQREARRNEELRLEALTKMRTRMGMAFGLKPGNAKEMQASIDRIAASVSIGRDEVEKYNQQLYNMGLRGAKLDTVLEATAIKASALGDEAAQHTMGWGAALAHTGGNVNKLADSVKARFGGIVAKQMLSSEVQAKKLQEASSTMFAGLDIEPLLKAKASLNAMWSQSTESGKALKSILAGLLQPLIDMVAKVQPIMKRFFQGLIISVLEIEIAFLKIRKAWRKVFGSSEMLKGIDLTEAALKAGKAAVYILLGSFVALGLIAIPIIWGLASALVGLAAPFIIPILAIGALTYAVVAAVDFIGTYWTEGWAIMKETVTGWWDTIANIKWGELGMSIVRGIVDGLTSGLNWVNDAMNNIANVAWESFAGNLGIHSPSKVFAELGAAIPQGVTKGIQRGTPEAQAAAGNIVQPPPAGAAEGSGARGGSGATITIEVGGITVNAKGEDQAKSIALNIRTELETVLEQLALQLGAEIP